MNASRSGESPTATLWFWMGKGVKTLFGQGLLSLGKTWGAGGFSPRRYKQFPEY